MQTYLAKPVFTDGFGSEESGFLQEDLVSGMSKCACVRRAGW